MWRNTCKEHIYPEELKANRENMAFLSFSFVWEHFYRLVVNFDVTVNFEEGQRKLRN
jgi:hypothetical protein